MYDPGNTTVPSTVGSALRVPRPNTLKRYGLTEQEWFDIAARQGYSCAVCQQIPKSGRLCVDHDHEPRWKHKPPEERKKAVRGLLCFRCNTTFVGRGVTIERSRNVTRYLELYETRRGRGRD